MTQVTISEKTFNKVVKSEIIKHIPCVKGFKKSHVAVVGYVFFLYNYGGEKVGQCFRDGEFMKLNILN